MSPGLLSVIAITTINLALLARWNSSANGETSKITTLCPPLSLNIVTLSGCYRTRQCCPVPRGSRRTLRSFLDFGLPQKVSIPLGNGPRVTGLLIGPA